MSILTANPEVVLVRLIRKTLIIIKSVQMKLCNYYAILCKDAVMKAGHKQTVITQHEAHSLGPACFSLTVR